MKRGNRTTYHGVKAVIGLHTGSCRFQGGVGSLSDAVGPMVATLPRPEVVMDEKCAITKKRSVTPRLHSF